MSWRAERGTFLKELTRLEARGVFTNGQCERCTRDGQYRCVDCLAVQLLCEKCTRRTHSFNPLHVIEVSPSIPHRLPCTVLTRLTVEMEWFLFREVIPSTNRSCSSARPPPLRSVHESPKQYQNLHRRSHQRGPPCEPRILRVLRGWQAWDPCPATPSPQTFPSDDTGPTNRVYFRVAQVRAAA